MSIVSAIIELISSILTQVLGGSSKLTAEEKRDLKQAKSVAHLVQPSDGDDFNEGDYWYSWEGLEYGEFWRRIFDIEAAGSESPDAMDRKAREYDLDGLRGHSRVKGTFMRHFGQDPAFMQAMADARAQEMQGWMSNAATESNLLEPINGVSCEQWATISATLTSMGDDKGAYHKLLAQHGLDAEAFEQAQREWTHRMQSADDPMGAAAISQVYGKAFTAARSGGAYSDGANAASATMGSVGGATGGAEPCSFEKYAEIMGAQAAWSKEGRDIHAMLQETFGISVMDYSDIGMYWMTRTQQDTRLSGQLHDRMDHFEAQYRTTSAADADLVL